jgi:predicted DNA-binding transcriptional regulator AlpA
MAARGSVITIPATPQDRAAPADRGRLLKAQQVADELFGGTVSASWVRRHVPNKIRLGHSTVRWYQLDVRAWLESLRTEP